MWPDRRLIDLFGIEYPIIQAPMAGSSTPEMAAAVSNAGGLGSVGFGALAFGQATIEHVRGEIGQLRSLTNRPFNINFFCNKQPVPDPVVNDKWCARLAPYYAEFGLDLSTSASLVSGSPFDETACDLVVEMRPAVVSFHFGLPDSKFIERLKSANAKIMSSATTVAEACWLEAHGADAIIAQGFEAGGHRGIFLTDSLASQVGTMALVPQVVDAVRVPVIAAGGIGDARGILAALALGAAGVQMGTAFLFCPEASLSSQHRTALDTGCDDGTAVTNVFTGRPARALINRAVTEIGPINEAVPQFPLAASAMRPLRVASEARGVPDFVPLWSGQSAGLGRKMGAAQLTTYLANEVQARLHKK